MYVHVHVYVCVVSGCSVKRVCVCVLCTTVYISDVRKSTTLGNVGTEIVATFRHRYVLGVPIWTCLEN